MVNEILSSVLNNIRVIVQIAFWILVGTLSLLTYLHARKTFFQPLKTEVFKLQLESLKRVSELLNGKGEWDLCEHFDLPEICSINSWRALEHHGYVNLRASSDLDELLRNAQNVSKLSDEKFRPHWKFDPSLNPPRAGSTGFFGGISVTEKIWQQFIAGGSFRKVARGEFLQLVEVFHTRGFCFPHTGAA